MDVLTTEKERDDADDLVRLSCQGINVSVLVAPRDIFMYVKHVLSISSKHSYSPIRG